MTEKQLQKIRQTVVASSNDEFDIITAEVLTKNQFFQDKVDEILLKEVEILPGDTYESVINKIVQVLVKKSQPNYVKSPNI